MPVALSQIGKVYGDRAIVKKLGGPEKKGGLFLPKNIADKPKQYSVWFGEIEKLGDGMQYVDAFGLKVGDVVAVTDMGAHCETFKGDDNFDHVWVAEEFIVAIDAGRIRAHLGNDHTDGLGIIPIGGFVCVKADAQVESKNGVVIPTALRETQKTGTVIAVSAGEVVNGNLYPIEIEVGWTILFGQYSGQKVSFWDDEYLLMKKEDIICQMVREAANV